MIELINKKIANHSTKLDVLSLFAVLINCIFILIYTYEYNLEPVDLIFNIAVSISALCVLSIFVYFWNSQKQNLFPGLWFISIFLGLGFFSIYTVLITGGKKYLVLNLSSSLLLLAMIVDWFFFIFISLTGASIAYITFLFTDTNPIMEIIHPSKKLYLLSYLISYTFLSISLFMRQKEKVQAKKMDFMKVFGSAIAHEVNAPLASMKMMSDVLDSIVQSVEVKKDNDKFIMTLDKIDYEMLTNTINNGLKKSSSDAAQIIEMLLSALREKYTNNKILCNVALIAKDAVSMASHLNTDGMRISLTVEKDFEIICSRQLMKHVIYNLIKNAFKHGGPDVKVDVKITNHKIVIEDNGVGIPEEKLKKIFDAFETNGNGSGIGLAFCKFVLDEIDGKITCESEVEKYTRFIIWFENIHK
jgi:signal transduction histidine kinase